MFHGILRFFGDRSISITLFLLPILLVLLQTALWDWQTSKRLARRGMFFGARVGPEFIASARSDWILKRFRLGIWFLSVALVSTYVLCVLFPWRNPLPPQHLVKSILVLSFAQGAGNLILFGLANRQTRREAAVLPGPSTRTAALFIEQAESSGWLTVLDWLGILLPVGIPLVTVSIVILSWNHFPGNYSPLAELRGALFSEAFGIFAAATYFALRFRARSSDWAPDPRASRRYRTLLGLMQSSVFCYIIFDGCWLSLMPILRGSQLGDMNTYFHFSFPASLCFLLVLLLARMHLSKNLARESSDAMPDHCWKWGCFYFNPGDSALIVPSRSGTGYSYNYASRSVWFVGAITGVVALFTFISFFLSY
jgi:hypothetical protein